MIYECLSCYKRWESRMNPDDWNYCPYCACKWIGKETCGEDKVFKYKGANITSERAVINLQIKSYVLEEEGNQGSLFECLDQDNESYGWKNVDRFELHNLEYVGEDICKSQNHYDQIKHCKNLGIKILDHAKKLKAEYDPANNLLYTDGIELRVSVKYPNQDEYFIPITRQVESIHS